MCEIEHHRERAHAHARNPISKDIDLFERQCF